MARVRIVSYKQGNTYTLDLAEAADVLRLHDLVRTRYVPRRGDVLINWGCSSMDKMPRNAEITHIMNHPLCVADATNKLKAFKQMEYMGVAIPEYTTTRRVAQEWAMASAGEPAVVVRHRLTGARGEGIEIINGGGLVPAAPLYTRYFKRKKEYRIHVWDDRIIHEQERKRKRGETINPHVRNVGSGWVFCCQNVVAPQCVRDAARGAVEALGLTFGAVDIGYNEHYDRAAVFEVNTAPAIEGTTLEKYAMEVRRYK